MFMVRVCACLLVLLGFSHEGLASSPTRLVVEIAFEPGRLVSGWFAKRRKGWERMLKRHHVYGHFLRQGGGILFVPTESSKAAAIRARGLLEKLHPGLKIGLLGERVLKLEAPQLTAAIRAQAKQWSLVAKRRLRALGVRSSAISRLKATSARLCLPAPPWSPRWMRAQKVDTVGGFPVSPKTWLTRALSLRVPLSFHLVPKQDASTHALFFSMQNNAPAWVAPRQRAFLRGGMWPGTDRYFRATSRRRLSTWLRLWQWRLRYSLRKRTRKSWRLLLWHRPPPPTSAWASQPWRSVLLEAKPAMQARGRLRFRNRAGRAFLYYRFAAGERKAFSKLLQTHVGRRLAVVLGEEVVATPVILGPLNSQGLWIPLSKRLQRGPWIRTHALLANAGNLPLASKVTSISSAPRCPGEAPKSTRRPAVRVTKAPTKSIPKPTTRPAPRPVPRPAAATYLERLVSKISVRLPKRRRWKVPVQGLPRHGPLTAPVTLVVFNDFSCFYCRNGQRVLSQIAKQFRGKIRLYFRPFPMESEKKGGFLPAQAALAAHRQGKFWAYREAMFAQYRKLKGKDLLDIARRLGLNLGKFRKDMASESVRAQVKRSLHLAERLEVPGVPTIYVNGRQTEAKPGLLRQLIRQELKAVMPLVNKGLSGDFLYQVLISKGKIAPDTRSRDPIRFIAPGDAAARGKARAPVTLVEFSDFQCPHCAQTSKVLDRLWKLYRGKLRWIFKHQPSPSHTYAPLAARAAIAAQKQGKFWAYRRLLFDRSDQIDRAALLKWAGELKMDLKAFRRDMDAAGTLSRIQRDLMQGRYLGVQGTPAIFINGKVTHGGQSLIQLKGALDVALKASGYKQADLPQLPPHAIPTAQSPSKGPKDAPVTIVEFSDFECPYCVAGARLVDNVVRSYRGHVRLVFKQFPLSFHPHAYLAAQAALAAHVQGKFWQYHDLLYNHQKKLQRKHLLGYARRLKLDVKAFDRALQQGTLKDSVDRDMALGAKLSVTGTPNFFVNGRRAEAYTFAKFKSIIDPILLDRGIPRRWLPKKMVHPVPLAQSPVFGAKKPLVTVAMVFDFQSPRCAKIWRKIRPLMRRFKRRVRWVFKHYPMPFHRYAKPAALAAVAAYKQGKFWAFADQLFAHQEKLKPADLRSYARRVGLKLKPFVAAQKSPWARGILKGDDQWSERVSLEQMPTFLLNGTRAKTPTAERLEAAIREVLQFRRWLQKRRKKK